jgi:HEAT repeat protein
MREQEARNLPIVKTLSMGALLVLAGLGCQSGAAFRPDRFRVSSVPAALETIRADSDPAHRQTAYEYLSEADHFADEAKRDEVVEILCLALKTETNPHARVRIVYAIGRLGGEKIWPGLHQAVGDSAPSVRSAACLAFAAQGSDAAVKKLEEILSGDSHIDVRLTAAEGLGRIQSRAAAHALLAGLQDHDIAIRYRCRESLRQITGSDFADDAGQWLQEIETANFEENKQRPGLLKLF